ncbi:thermostable hemolysin [Pseudomonas sp. PIC25]|uniref:thermostable hemolysin n=1 Tax=Pseudomonas sp. PIC25 TaxID=1958773 RepID=UPI000BAB7E6E|nr:thermostable hemolysin [Pseudomonas sp. PIC25]PAU54667.1 thermostable hemolysin [Pseudomonas sp. PIC25]
MELPGIHADGLLARIGREPAFGLRYAQHRHGERRALLEAFIRERFAEHYGARVRHFMPCLLGLESADGAVRGAVGLRAAGEAPLFLERYLDRPIEQVIAGYSGQPIARRDIVEVGNLAALGAGAARLLIVALTDLLVACGFRWVTFTGTPALLNSFQRLELSPLSLGPADPVCLGAEQADWGSYYANHPQVMAGEILGGHQRLVQMGVYPRLGYRALYSEGALPHAACH